MSVTQLFTKQIDTLVDKNCDWIYLKIYLSRLEIISCFSLLALVSLHLGIQINKMERMVYSVEYFIYRNREVHNNMPPTIF